MERTAQQKTKVGFDCMTIVSVIKEIYSRRELMKSLVTRNLKIRYKGSALGFFWSLMDPILMMVVYLIFAKLTRFQVDLAYLLTGIFIWQFLSLCVGDSFHAVIGNTSLVKKVYFPRLILPLSTALANAINFLLSLCVLMGFLLVFKNTLHFSHLIFLPVFIFFEFLICQGLAFLFSSLMVYFRDTQHLVGIGLMAWFFMSPVIYPIHLVPQRWFSLYLLNPMCTLLIGFRSCFLGTDMIWNMFTELSLALCVFIFIFGLWTFNKLEPSFGDEL